MAIENDLKRHIVATLDTLSEENLEDVAVYLDYLQYKRSHQTERATPHQPVALGGQWEGTAISDEEIADIRHEMWDNFGEHKM